ncbi:MAG: ABC transporter permease [Gammaproteobacteria bacterium]|nr:ABC transporter permease [Gammaproteobacteria bacterium]
MISDTWYLFKKYMIISARMPLWSLFALIQPLIWLFIFGSLFGHFAQLPGFPAESYIDYFLPGVLIMTVLFGSSWAGVSLLREISAGTVDKMLASPASRASIVLSRVLHAAVQVVVQALIVLIAAWMMGASTTWNPLYVSLVMIIVLLMGIAFASISNGLAIMLQREEPLVVLGNIMTLPLMFFSSAMVPEQYMPQWIQYIAIINPIEYAVGAIRAIFVGEVNLAAYGQGLAIMLVFAAGTLAWAISAFKALRD